MSLGYSICWRGPPGSGKRTALQQQLQAWAKSIGQLYVLKKQLWNAPVQGGECNDDSGDAEDDESDKLIPMEISILHWGFDVARMSLKDKRYVSSILQRWGRGSQVLTAGQRCLVFYNAHLLCSESIMYLQAFLEENHLDTVVWMTSEYPLSARLSDWLLDIPVASSVDYSLKAIRDSVSPEAQIASIRTVEEDIRAICEAWLTQPALLSDVKKIRAIVYGLLHRNIRWVTGFHTWLFIIDSLPLTPDQRKKVAAIFTSQPYTGTGQTVPSYRIPILWEEYLCLLRNALAPPDPTPEADSSKPIVKRTKKNAKSTSSS
jgi:hypothetical protein